MIYSVGNISNSQHPEEIFLCQRIWAESSQTPWIKTLQKIIKYTIIPFLLIATFELIVKTLDLTICSIVSIISGYGHLLLQKQTAPVSLPPPNPLPALEIFQQPAALSQNHPEHPPANYAELRFHSLSASDIEPPRRERSERQTAPVSIDELPPITPLPNLEIVQQQPVALSQNQAEHPPANYAELRFYSLSASDIEPTRREGVDTGRILKEEIERLKASNHPGWQEQAVKRLRRAYFEDPKLEIDRLRATQTYTNETEVRMEDTLFPLATPQNVALLKVMVGRVLEIQKIYKETHYVFMHAQSWSWLIYMDLLNELMKGKNPGADVHQFKYLRIPRPSTIRTIDHYSTNDQTNDHRSNHDLISADGFFTTIESMSRLFIFCQKIRIYIV